jgi:hypothetical protein
VIICNMARTYLEQWAPRTATYEWTLLRADGGGFLVHLRRGEWRFVIGPMDGLFTDVLDARRDEDLDAENEPIDTASVDRRGGSRRTATPGGLNVARRIRRTQ